MNAMCANLGGGASALDNGSSIWTIPSLPCLARLDSQHSEDLDISSSSFATELCSIQMRPVLAPTVKVAPIIHPVARAVSR